MWVLLVRCACGGRYYDRPSYGYDRCPLASLALLQQWVWACVAVMVIHILHHSM